ncbi:MAG TPA: ATP-binding protein, partial [Saprospiraceae bacterium]|nr:ATP-binding protein [Saprospiraceae bacterium]
MPSNKRNFSQFLSNLRKSLKIRKDLPRELVNEFTIYKDINSIDRMHVTAWMGFIMSLLLFALDYIRYQRGTWDHNKQVLFYCHIIGLLFIIPAIHISRSKQWIIQRRSRRAVVIWGMVVLSLVFILGQSIFVFLDRHSIVMYLALIFISGWMFAMSHKERVLFHAFTFTIMAYVIFVTPISTEIKVATYFELLFLTVIAFFFDAFDYNLRVSNFFKSKEVLEDQKRIKKLEEFKSRFFTNLTHELRTPLTMISGMAREIAEDPQRWATEGSEIIRRNSGSLLNLVNQILDLSKIESGSMPVHMVHGDVVSFIGYAVDAFRGSAALKNIRLHYITEDEEIKMDYDQDKYLTIVSNLLSNAIKFTPEDGNVYVQLAVLNSSNKNYLELTVRDTGIGLASEALSHIFERFYQTENEYAEKGMGSGIGLSMVQELVRILKGEIKVKSNPGKGTQFTILIPITNNADVITKKLYPENINAEVRNYFSPVNANITEESNVDITDKPEVLVIEDNADVIKYLQICLGDIYQVFYARDGQSGINKAIELIPDIIVSDVMMPGKDGVEVCNELKKHPCTSHIPIVLLSAKTDAASRIAGLESGADVYMLKPFEKAELRAQIRNLLDQLSARQSRYSDLSKPVPVLSDSVIDIEDEFVGRVRTVVHQHLDEPEFSVNHLCRAIFLSRTQLHKKLKALTGQSASAFIRQIRLFAALEMLKTTDN